MLGLLASTPGVANFSRVDTFPLVNIDDISERARRAWAHRLAGKAFCVRVKRTGEHEFSSMAVERAVGAALLAGSENARVQLKNPEVLVPIEIRGEQCFLLDEVRRGLGGFPLGTQNSVVSLISGGFDSTVASYLTMKRGLFTHFCFFNLGGRAHELGVKEVAQYLWRKFGASRLEGDQFDDDSGGGILAALHLTSR